MERTLDFGDEKSLQEANQFLAKLKEAKIDKKYNLIFNKPNIYKKKILSAHFLIKFENDFYLKVLKEYNVYDFEFISTHFKNGKTTFYESRAYNLNFFDLLCVKFDDIYFDADNYFPKNFEETLTFKTYYEYRDIKNKRYYGIIPIKAIEFIKNNYQFILNNVCHNTIN